MASDYSSFVGEICNFGNSPSLQIHEMISVFSGLSAKSQYTARGF
jgi:hypothetical protein